MKKLFLILPVIFIAFYAIHVLPFGIKQDEIEDDVTSIRHELSGYSNVHNEISSLDELNQKLGEILSTHKQLSKTELRLDDISARRDFIRRHTWKKPKYDKENLYLMDSLLNQLYYQLPGLISKHIRSESKKATAVNVEGKGIQKINSKLSEFNRDIKQLTMHLDRVNKKDLDAVISIRKSDLRTISQNNSDVIKKIAYLQQKRRRAFYATVRKKHAVHEINAEIKSYNEFLRDVKETLKVIGDIGVAESALRRGVRRVKRDVAHSNAIASICLPPVRAKASS